MNQITKKKLKKVAIFAPAIISASVSIGSFVQFGLANNEQQDLVKANNKLYDQVTSSVEFNKYYDEYRTALYNAYRSGIITAKE